MLLGLGIAAAALCGAAPSVAAASPSGRSVSEGSGTHRVRFAPGTDHAEVTGAIGDGISDHYVLRAGAGQQLIVSGLGSLHLAVEAPDGSLLPGGPGDVVTFDLPETGDYVVEIMPGMGEADGYQIAFEIPVRDHDEPATRVQFPHGTYGTTIHGRVDGGQIDRYLLRAAPGRTMTVTLDASQNAARFSVLAPDGRVLAGEQTSASVALPDTGDYTVAVWSIGGNPTYDVSLEIR